MKPDRPSLPPKPPKEPHYLITALGFSAAVAAGVWINLATGTLPAAKTWAKAIVLLQWENGWLLAAAILVALQILALVRWSRTKQRQQAAIRTGLGEIEHAQLCNILTVAVRGISALRADVRVNARYFESIVRDGRSILRKVPEVHIETDQMPDEYGLDTAILDEDNLVICAAYRQRVPIYEYLEDGHLQRYGSSIRHLVDPRQRWVLACPVIPVGGLNNLPQGVICFYSTQEIVRNSRDEVQLKNVAVATAAAFAGILGLQQSLPEFIV